MEKPSTATFVIRGITLLVIGTMVMLYTDAEIKALYLVPGLVITAGGVVQASFSYWVRKKLIQWQWYFVGGLAIMSIGIVWLLNPNITLGLLKGAVGVWFFYQAAQDFIGMNHWRKTTNQNWWAMAVLFVVEVALGLLLLLDPLGEAMRDTAFIGSCMIFGAVVALFARYHLKRGDYPATPPEKTA